MANVGRASGPYHGLILLGYAAATALLIDLIATVVLKGLPGDAFWLAWPIMTLVIVVVGVVTGVLRRLLGPLGIIATIILLYYGDMIGLKGRLRQLYGWGIIVLSDIAFAAVTVFEMKRLFISEAEQQPLVNIIIYVMDFGLSLLLLLLAAVMVWRLVDLFKKKGRWSQEKDQELAEEVAK